MRLNEENPTRRLCFNLNGLMGGLIATVLLLAILVGLTIWGIKAQQTNAETFYKIKDPQSIKFKSDDNAKHYEIVK